MLTRTNPAPKAMKIVTERASSMSREKGKCGWGKGQVPRFQFGFNIRCSMLDVRCSAAAKKTNIKHPTSNVEIKANTRASPLWGHVPRRATRLYSARDSCEELRHDSIV